MACKGGVKEGFDGMVRGGSGEKGVGVKRWDKEGRVQRLEE